MSAQLRDLSHMVRCFLTTLMLLLTPATDLLLSPWGYQICLQTDRQQHGTLCTTDIRRQFACIYQVEGLSQRSTVNSGSSTQNSKKAQRHNVYKLQNSINWYMYFFWASGWCKSFLFQNMHIFQSGSLTFLNNSWKSESSCQAYMTLVMTKKIICAH